MEKQRKLEEDKHEEDRIRRELDELKNQYAQEMKDDGSKREPFDFSNVDQQQNFNQVGDLVGLFSVG